MNYKEKIKKLANNGTVLDKGDIIIRDMSKVIDNILDYRYSAEHQGNKVLEDKKNPIANSIAILISDLEVYEEMLEITDKVSNRKEERVDRITERVP